jgi:hypothetical protein
MKHEAQLRRHTYGLIIGFALQFLIGMSLNLFVTLPSSHPGTSGNNYFTRAWHGLVWSLSGRGGFALTAHIVLGIFLLLGCVGLFARGMRLHRSLWAWTGSIAALFTLGAIFNGLSFVNFNHNISSMIMATCWLIAVGSLITGIIRSGAPEPHN